MPRIGLERKNQRRRQIVEAAWRCAARMGFRDLTVDDVCAEAKLSKGAFYGYFEQKRDLLVALFEDDARRLDELMDDLERRIPNQRDRLRVYTQSALARSSDPALVQVRADIWSAMLTEKEVRGAFAAGMQERRVSLKKWIEDAIKAGELVDIPANAFASILLALSDGLLLHGSLDPNAFRWINISKALDMLLNGISS
ncbi:MAG: TetR/AcrR family transcriptional regulator [Candidatus Dormibacteraceae bacterium]